MNTFIKVSESIKPRGLVYTCREGHDVFVPQSAVRAYVDGPENGPDPAPKTCEKCDLKEEEK